MGKAAMAKAAMAKAALRVSRATARRKLAEMQPSALLHNFQNRAELFLVGVEHGSPAIATAVQKLIKEVQPDVVAVELCESRSKSSILTGETQEKYKLSEFFRIPGNLKQKFITYGVVNMCAALDAKGIKPGDEFRCAVEQGRALGAKIAFMDQDIEVTLERSAQHFSLKELLYFFRDEVVIQYRRCLLSLWPSLKGKFGDSITLKDLADRAEMGTQCSPELYKVLVDERNEHMVNELRNMEGKIVGIVGALHVSGMQELWEQAEAHGHYKGREGSA